MEEIVTLETGKLRDFGLTERRLHEYIAKNPTAIGISDVICRASELTQQGAGRLDLLLESTAKRSSRERYVVEIQRDESDETHTVRMLEYLCRERKRVPDYNYSAVLVAENIVQGRFFNVLSMLGEHIPIIAINVLAAKLPDGKFGFAFSHALDINVVPTETEDSDTPQKDVSEDTWREEYGDNTVDLANKIRERLGDNIGKYFTKSYAGIEDPQQGRTAKCKIHPQQSKVWVRFNIPKSEEWDERIAGYGLHLKHVLGSYWFAIRNDDDVENHAAILREMYREVAGYPPDSEEDENAPN